MTNSFLKDAVARITRDLERKLSWEDRVIGTMRLIMKEGVTPENFAKGAAIAAQEFAEGNDVRAKLAELWPQPWTEEHEALAKLIGC
jgi:mannitol-1-phosphate/altronate dehydrogenase